ncbi:hypothetical protein STEG23_007535 [Scotinomys teguina]
MSWKNLTVFDLCILIILLVQYAISSQDQDFLEETETTQPKGNTSVAKKAPGNKEKTSLLLVCLPLPLQQPHSLDKMMKNPAFPDARDVEMCLQFSEP